MTCEFLNDKKFLKLISKKSCPNFKCFIKKFIKDNPELSYEIFEYYTINNLINEIITFNNSIISDSIFQTLDKSFINDSNEQNFNALCNYLLSKSLQLNNIIVQKFGFGINSYFISDNLIPMIGENGSKFSDFINGNIQLPNKDCYSHSILALIKGYSINNSSLKKFVISHKIGVVSTTIIDIETIFTTISNKLTFGSDSIEKLTNYLG